MNNIIIRNDFCQLKSFIEDHASNSYFNKHNKARCCLHSDKTASLSIYMDGDIAKFKCFGCKKQGDIINMHQYLIQDGKNAREVAIELVKKGYLYDEDINKEEITKNKNNINKNVVKLSIDEQKNKIKEYYRNKFISPNKDIILQDIYLYKCIITNNIDFKIRLLETEDIVEFKKILTKTKKAFRYVHFDKEYNIQEKKNPKVQTRMFINSVIKRNKENGYVVIVEGEKDAISLQKEGIFSISIGDSQIEEYIKNLVNKHCISTVFIFSDYDTAGREYANKLEAEIEKFNKKQRKSKQVKINYTTISHHMFNMFHKTSPKQDISDLLNSDNQIKKLCFKSMFDFMHKHYFKKCDFKTIINELEIQKLHCNIRVTYTEIQCKLLKEGSIHPDLMHDLVHIILPKPTIIRDVLRYVDKMGSVPYNFVLDTLEEQCKKMKLHCPIECKQRLEEFIKKSVSIAPKSQEYVETCRKVLFQHIIGASRMVLDNGKNEYVHDLCVIIYGEQGCGKTLFVNRYSIDYLRSVSECINSLYSPRQMGALLNLFITLPENAFVKSDIELLKDIMTDRQRTKIHLFSDRKARDILLYNIFSSTTNEACLLRDR